MNDELRDIFVDTLATINIENYKNGTTTKYDFTHNVKFMWTPKDEKNIEVQNMDTVSSATILSKVGKTAVLNMASPKRPGGGVRNGARAQEECLFRCSNLATSISEDFYPLNNDVALYTKDAIFFKDRYYNKMEPITVDVITIAALNLNNYPKDDTYEPLTKDKIRLMLSLPIINGVKNIVLGAWGCGVFDNDPSEMSNMFYDVIVNEGYYIFFDNIKFAIINDHNSVGNNYTIFKNKFN